MNPVCRDSTESTPQALLKWARPTLPEVGCYLLLHPVPGAAGRTLTAGGTKETGGLAYGRMSPLQTGVKPRSKAVAGSAGNRGIAGP
jgi:hypothetical protein